MRDDSHCAAFGGYHLAGFPGMIPLKNNNGSSYAEGMPPDGRL